MTKKGKLDLFTMLVPHFYKGFDLLNIPSQHIEFILVLFNLQKLCNTRKGSVPCNPDYGIPDFLCEQINVMHEVLEYTKILEDTIKKYEPRLKSIRIIQWDIDNKKALLYCILFTKLVSGKTCRFKILFKGMGNNSVEFG